MTRFGPVHSPAGPGPIIWVQVHLYLDLDPDIWGLVWFGPGSTRSRTRLWTVYLYHKLGSEDECEKGFARKSLSRLALRLEIQFPWSWQRIVAREDSQWMHVLKGGYVGWVLMGLEFFNFSRVLKVRITLFIELVISKTCSSIFAIIPRHPRELDGWKSRHVSMTFSISSHEW